ncbi:MAG: NTP transferase domain-containing protein [Candidatus Krumholzibacteriota bacterium]|nr:NTP transferase domain-containing protein [Candidatus Krumholzibacteriota bacterium]
MKPTAIVPAAGVGTRLRPHTWSLPKALLPVAGRPVIGHILDQLLTVGVERVVLVVGYLGDRLVDWVREHYDLEVDFVVQERRLGLGHAIHTTAERCPAGPALIVLGDTIVQADLSGLLAAPGHGMGVKAVDDPRRFGVAEVADGRIVRLVEKPAAPTSDLALVGLYHLRDVAALHEGLRYLVAGDRRTRGEYQLTDALQWMIDHGELLSPFPIAGWFDVGKPETWLATNRSLLAGAPVPAPRPGVTFHPPVWVPDSAVVAESAIGPFVSVGESARIMSCRIENSIIGDGTELAGCRLEDSLLAPQCRLKDLQGSFNLGEESRARGATPPDGP